MGVVDDELRKRKRAAEISHKKELLKLETPQGIEQASAPLSESVSSFQPVQTSILKPNTVSPEVQKGTGMDPGVVKAILSSDDPRVAAALVKRMEAARELSAPPGGLGDKSISSLFGAIYDAPKGTGRLSTDKGGGVIEKVKGRPSGDALGFGEGNVYVPGRDESYQIRTPTAYKEARGRFSDEIKKTGGIPSNLEGFIPGERSLLRPGPAGKADAIPDTYTDYGSDVSPPASTPKQPTVFTPQEQRVEGGRRSISEDLKNVLGIPDNARTGRLSEGTTQEQTISSEIARLKAKTQGGGGGSLLNPSAPTLPPSPGLPIDDVGPSSATPKSRERASAKKKNLFLKNMLDKFHQSGTPTGSFGSGSLLTRRR